MLQRKQSNSSSCGPKVKVRLMCQGRKDEVWSVAESVDVCGLKESYKQKNKIQLSQDLMWMFNGREIHDDERMFEIGVKYRRENVIMIMKKNTDRPSIGRDCHTFSGTPIDQVTILDDEEHEVTLDTYRDFEDEYFDNSETDEDFNNRQDRFEKMKKVKEASEKRRDRQTFSVKLAEQVENYKGDLEIGEILKNIGEHKVETKHKPKKGKVKKKKSNTRTKLKESPPENIEQEVMVKRKQNDKKVDVNHGEVLIEQSTESTDDNLDASSWEKVSKGSRKKTKSPGMEKKPEEGKYKKFIVKSFEDSWPPLESNPSYKRTVVSSRNNAASTETCPSFEKNDSFFDNVAGQNRKSLDESDCNANIKESKEVVDRNANIKEVKKEVFLIKLMNETATKSNTAPCSVSSATESNTAPSSISQNCQQEQIVDINQANYSDVKRSPLITSKIEPSSQPLPKVTDNLKSSNVLQELSPTPKTTEHKILKGNVPEVKESILDCLPKIEKDFFCPIKTCPLVSDVVPFGPQTKTVNHFHTIPRSASNIIFKSPFECEKGSFSNAGQTENYECGSSTDSAKLNNSHEGIMCSVVSIEVTANSDLAASSQSSSALMEDRDTNTWLQEDELVFIQPNLISEAEETCTPSSDESPEDSDELATLQHNRINDVSSEHLLCGTRDQEDSKPVQARVAHERQSVTSQPEFPIKSTCPPPKLGLALSQLEQNCLLPSSVHSSEQNQAVLFHPAENLPYDGSLKSPVTALPISSLSFGLDNAETPPANISSDDKTYEGSLERTHNLLHPKNLKDLHIIEEDDFSSKVSDVPYVPPPEQLLSPLHDDEPPDAPGSGQKIVFLQPLVFFCAPQLPCFQQSQVSVAASQHQLPHVFFDTSQQPDAFSGISQQPDALSGTSQQQNSFFGSSEQPNPLSGTSQKPHASQQPNAFYGSSQQPDALSGTFQQPQLYPPNRFSDSTPAPVMLTLPPEQPSVRSTQLQTYITTQHLPQQYQLAGTGQLHQVLAQQHPEQFPGGVQKEQPMFSGLPQPQQFFNVQYPQLSNVPVQQLLPSQQPQLPCLLQQQLQSAQQQPLPSTQQQQLPSTQQQQLPSVQQHLFPSVEQQLPSLQQHLLPSVLQQPLSSTQQQQLPSVQQHLFPSEQQQLTSLQQHLLPSVLQQPLLSTQQQQHLSVQQQLPSVQQHLFPSEQQQLPSLQQHLLPSVLQQPLPSTQQQQRLSVQQQLPSVQRQQLLSMQQELPSPQQHLLPDLQQQRPYVQQLTSMNLPQQQQQLTNVNLYESVQQQQHTVDPQFRQFPFVQQQLFGVNLPQSHHCLPAEHSAHHQHVSTQYLPVEHSQQLYLPHQQVLDSFHQREILGEPQAQQVLPVHQICDVNQSGEPQDN